jgi:hypothetical protein
MIATWRTLFTANPDPTSLLHSRRRAYLKNKRGCYVAKRDSILADVNLEAQEGRQDTAMEVTVDA